MTTEICTLKGSCIYAAANDALVLDLRGVLPMTLERSYALKIIAKDGKHKFKRLLMTGQHDLYKSLGRYGLQIFLKSKAFDDLEVVMLDRCELDCFPDLDHCENLEIIDISNNRLGSKNNNSKIIPDLKLEKLRQLRLHGNPIPKIAFSLKNVPKLEKLSLGSEDTNIIGGKIIEQSVTKKSTEQRLLIEVEPEYRGYLTVPLLIPLYTTCSDSTTEDVDTTIQASMTRSMSISSSVALPQFHSTPLIGSRSTRSASVSIDPGKMPSGTSSNVTLPSFSFQVSHHSPSAETAIEEKYLNLFEYVWKVKKVMNFGHEIKDELSRLQAMECVLEEVNCAQPLYNLILTSQTDLYREQPGQLKRFLKHPGLHQLNYLYLDKCDLMEVLDISNLESLHTLDISYNKIHSLADLKNSSIRTLRVTGNLFQTLDFKPDKVKSLAEVSFGSDECQFVHFKILQKTSTGSLTLSLSDEYKEKLIVPPVEYLQNIEELSAFVSCRELCLPDVYNFYPEKQHKYLQWLSENSEVKYEIFSLTGKGKTGFDLSSCFKASLALRNLREALLENCGIEVVPKMSSLLQAEVVDIRNNEIKELDESFFPLSMKRLLISGNPIHCVDVECTRFENLSEIECGSNETHLISTPIMSEMLGGRLSVVVPGEYREHLYLPPAAVFDDETHLQPYVENQEKYLIHIPDIEHRVVALQWLLPDKTEFNKDDFLLYDWLFKTPSDTNHLSLKNIKTLDISHCNVTNLPDLKHLDSLERLLLIDNNVTDLSTLKLSHLEYIDVRQNPIKMVHIDFCQCPKLTLIEAGSDETRYLSVEVLKRLSDGQVKVKLEEANKKNIMLPPQHLVRKGLEKKEIGQYLCGGIFDVSWYVLEDHDKDDADVEKLLDTLSNDQRKILNFKMTNKPDFDRNIDTILETHNLCNMKILNLSNCKMSRTLSYQHLCHLTDINLSGNPVGEDLGRLQQVIDTSNCTMSLCHFNLSDTGLKRTPGIVNFSGLKVLNISNNSIESLEKLENNSLENLIVDGNNFPVLDFCPEKVPCVTKVSFGSETCKFVSFAILRKALSSTLTLNLCDDFKHNLFVPLPNILNDKEKLEKYVNSREINLHQFNLQQSETDQQIQCISHLTNYEGLQYDCFSLDGQVSFCFSSGIPKSLPLMPTITSLALSSCNLRCVPDISRLFYLKTIVLRDNKIDNCDNLENRSVNEIVIENNPIVGFDLKENNLPCLWYLKIGSNSVKYISLSLLKKVRDSRLTIDISPCYRNYLVFPTKEYITDMDLLNTFVSNSSLDLSAVSVDERKGVFEWVLKHCGPQLKSLRMVPEEDIGEELAGLKTPDSALEWNFESCSCVQEINVNNCGLKRVPDLSFLTNLEVINAKNNMIEDIDDNLLPSSLRILSIEGNPIEFLNINCSRLPYLRELVFGSKVTRYLSFSVVRCLCDGKATVPVKFRQYLSLPPAALLEEKHKLVSYCKSPERYLEDIPDMEVRSKALKWLFCGSGFHFSKLNFDSQGWLLDRCIDLSCITLKNTDTLILSNCDLQMIPKFNGMSQLKQLTINNNRLSDITLDETMASLETLDLVGNPIRKIDFDPEQFPGLQRISFGSEETWFVGSAVLNKFLTGNLVLDVPINYRDKLLTPPWEIIKKGIGSVRKFTKSISLDVSHISDHQKKRKAIEHQLSRKDTNFTSIYFTDEKEYCQLIRYDGLLFLFQHRSLSLVKYLFLSDCGLKTIPEWNGMANLKFADVSGNKLDSIPRSDSLKELNISRNKFTRATSFDNILPSLVDLVVGSDVLNFVSFNLLNKVTIDSRYRHVLIMPPPCVLNDCEMLGNYVKQPERYLVHVKIDERDEAINWLVNEADFEFHEMDMSRMKEMFNVPESRCSQLLQGQNVKNIRTLDISHCDLGKLLDVTQLEFLETLLAAGNNLTDISTLNHPCLKYLDVSENPIETIDLNFKDCPELVEIKVGSKETKCLSVKVLERASSDEFDFNVTFCEEYKANIVVPPQDIVDCLKKNSNRYLNDCEFDVSWYISENQGQLGNLLDHFICILSLDKRNILKFRLCDLPSHQLVLQSNLNILLKHERLQNVEHVIIANCNIDFLPAFQHLSNLEYIDLSGNKILSANERIQIIQTQKENFPSLKHINLNNNKLTKLPDLTGLLSLEFLAVAHNDIQSLAELSNENLQTLYAVGNSFEVLDLDPEKTPSLSVIKFGSNNCHFVDFPVLLKASTGALTLQMDEQYKRYLMVPPPGVLENTNELDKYVRCKELSPSQFRAHESELIFKCLLRLVESRSYESLNLACCPLEMLQLERLFSKIALQTKIDADLTGMKPPHQNLKKVNLKNCKLNTIPDLSECLHLEDVDLGDNNIQNINENYLPSSIKKLSVEGNPIPYLKLNCDSYPNLSSIQCGSGCTEYISAEIMQKVNEETLTMIIDEKCKRFLCMPPPIVLDNKEHLLNYFQNPERYLPFISNMYKRSTSLYWLLVSSTFPLHTLDFTSQSWLFETDSALSRISLENVHTLILEKCGLQELPRLVGMPNLKYLSLHDNGLESIQLQHVPLLQTLIVTENRTEEIDVDFDSLPNLKVLAFGSDQTKFISLRILNRVVNKQLELRVPEEFRQYLLSPSWSIIDKGTECIQDYMECTVIDAAEITDSDSLKKVVLWKLERNMKIVSTCRLSGQKKLFRALNISALLGYQSLSFMTEIYISDCGLETLSDWGKLENLTYADLSFNSLNSIPRNLSIIGINVTGNKIHTLSFPKEDFPMLTKVTAGSPDLQFIRFDLLKRVTVTIDDEQKCCLIMPPPLALDQSNLANYLERPEFFLVHVDGSKLGKAIKWLVDDDDITFTDLDLSTQKIIFSDINISRGIWQGKNLQNLRRLNLNQCQLNNLPEIQNLEQLETLLIAQNNLTDISKLKHSCLETIDITENPIPDVSVDFMSCPNLTTIRAGSSETRVVSSNVMQKVLTSDFVIDIDERYKDKLMYPAPFVVNNNFEKKDIEEFLANGAFDVSWYTFKFSATGTTIVDILSNIVSLDQRDILTFAMCRLPDICLRIGKEIDILLAHEKLSDLEQISICECNMTYIPSLQCLPKLITIDLSKNQFDNGMAGMFGSQTMTFLSSLDVSHNQLSTVPNLIMLVNLKELNVSHNAITSLEKMANSRLESLIVNDNPLEVLDFSPASVPLLKKVTFGSDECQYISFIILENAPHLKLRLVERHKERLLIPHPDILETIDGVASFVHNTELHLKMFNTLDPEQQYQCIIWLIKSNGQKYKALNLRGKNEFCAHIGNGKLKQILSKLPNITELDLSDCNITTIPDIKCLPKIQSLDVTKDPIECIYIDFNSALTLQQIKCGSPDTHYITLPVVNRVLNGKLNVTVAKEFQPFLYLPSQDVLECRTKMLNYVAHPERFLPDVKDTRKRYEALTWLFTSSKSQFSVLDFSSQQWLFKKDSDVNIINLNEVDILSLNDCGLKTIPMLRNLSQVKHLNLSGNQIRKLFIDEELSSLVTLDISNNPVAEIDFDFEYFPRLRVLTFGSADTRYISHNVLEKFPDLELNVPKNYQEYMLLPSWETIEGGVDHIKVYMNNGIYIRPILMIIRRGYKQLDIS